MELFDNPTSTNIISWIIVGLVAGTIAHIFDRREVKGGIFGTVITGILGAMAGGIAADTLFGINYLTAFSLEGLLFAIGGSLVIIFLQRMFFRDTSHIKTSTQHFQ